VALKVPLADKEFQELLLRLSPTILGVKPAELINIKFKTLEKLHDSFKGYSELEYIEVRDFPHLNRKQLFFYHKESLREVIAGKANQKFLIKIGYPSAFDINIYLDIIIKKLQSDTFPHEIGIFLGYPLKDVIGYMGLSPLKLVKINGWRYYGSENLSVMHYKRFVKARDVFRVFLNNLPQIVTGD
jgi:hypothetical protein